MARVKVSIAPLLKRYGTRTVLAEALGIHPSNLSRVESVMVATAERYCDTLGLHPAEVWSDWAALVSQPPVPMRPCAAEGCPDEFTPRSSGGKPQRFCSTACADRERERRLYRTNQRYRERKNAARRAYYADYEKRAIERERRRAS